MEHRRGDKDGGQAAQPNHPPCLKPYPHHQASQPNHFPLLNGIRSRRCHTAKPPSITISTTQDHIREGVEEEGIKGEGEAEERGRHRRRHSNRKRPPEATPGPAGGQPPHCRQLHLDHTGHHISHDPKTDPTPPAILSSIS